MCASDGSHIHCLFKVCPGRSAHALKEQYLHHIRWRASTNSSLKSLIGTYKHRYHPDSRCIVYTCRLCCHHTMYKTVQCTVYILPPNNEIHPQKEAARVWCHRGAIEGGWCQVEPPIYFQHIGIEKLLLCFSIFNWICLLPSGQTHWPPISATMRPWAALPVAAGSGPTPTITSQKMIW